MTRTTPMITVPATLLAVFASANAHASYVTYTNTQDFIDATLPLQLEDFNSFTSDLNFGGSSLVFGDLTVSNPAASVSLAKIEVAPFSGNGVTVPNGSPYIRNINDERFNSRLVFSFEDPITAFGADVAGVFPGPTGTVIEVLGEVIEFPTSRTFFGFTSETPFTEVSFVLTNPNSSDIFGVDDVRYGTAIPAPSSACVSLLAGSLCAVRRRRASPGS